MTTFLQRVPLHWLKTCILWWLNKLGTKAHLRDCVFLIADICTCNYVIMEGCNNYYGVIKIIMLLIKSLIFHLQVLIRLLSTPWDLTKTTGLLMRSWWEYVLTGYIHYCMWVFVKGGLLNKMFSVEVNKYALTTAFVQRGLWGGH